jgi:alpha-D-ribose 1-methylphosphonate 5-triphosphate synthase subunit PhnL
MQITLKNFRCYENTTFNFNNGCTLISAKSGKGKSTILLGIYYALYGNKIPDVVYTKIGTTNGCSVELLWNNLIIYRASKPIVLLVTTIDDGKKYEDSAAQGIIDSIIGTSFLTTSYITQNPMNSFLFMSPNEKLEFLEQFVFKDVNISDLKQICKEEIQSLNESLLKSSSQKCIMEEVVLKNKQIDIPKFPYKSRPEDELKFFNREKGRLEKTLLQLKEEKNKSILLEKELAEEHVYETRINEVHHDLELVEKSIIELTNLLSQNTFCGKDVLNSMIQKLKINECVIEYHELVQKEKSLKCDIERMKKMELENIQKRLDELKSMIGEIDVSDNDLNEQKEILRDCKQLYDLRKDIEKSQSIVNKYSNFNELLQNISLKKFSCPSCKIALYEGSDDLIHIDNGKKEICNNEQRIKTLKEGILQYNFHSKKVTELTTLINSITNNYDDELIMEDIEASITFYNDEIQRCNQLIIEHDTLQKQIKEKKYSSNIILMENNLIELQKEINKVCIDDIDEICDDIVGLRQKIQEQMRFEMEYIQLEKSLKSYISRKEVLVQRLNTIKIPRKGILIEYNTNYENINKLENDFEMYTKNIHDMEEFFRLKKDFERWEELNKQLDIIVKEETEISTRYNSAKELKEIITNTGSIALSQFIEKFENTIQKYLDYFFTIDEPLGIEISMFKGGVGNKKVKASMNINVTNKGERMPLNTISGGELARVNLACTMALNEISNSPLLLLDECTSSLNAELTDTIFDAIHQEVESRNMCCIIIGHQVVKGIFDNVLETVGIN